MGKVCAKYRLERGLGGRGDGRWGAAGGCGARQQMLRAAHGRLAANLRLRCPAAALPEKLQSKILAEKNSSIGAALLSNMELEPSEFRFAGSMAAS